MTIEEAYQDVTHKHANCPTCNNIALIEDIRRPRSEWDKLIISINNMNVKLRIMLGKRIEVKEG